MQIFVKTLTVADSHKIHAPYQSSPSSHRDVEGVKKPPGTRFLSR